jgi:hypothetical protein
MDGDAKWACLCDIGELARLTSAIVKGQTLLNGGCLAISPWYTFYTSIATIYSLVRLKEVKTKNKSMTPYNGKIAPSYGNVPSSN